MRLLIPVFFLVAATAVAQDKFTQELFAIEMVESSGGLFMDHALITRGVQKGTRAGGRYGMMPHTVKLLIRRCETLQKKYNDLLLADSDEITAMLTENEKFDREISRIFWERLRRYFGAPRAAYAWYHGPGAATIANKSTILEDDYVQKFLSYLKRKPRREYASLPADTNGK